MSLDTLGRFLAQRRTWITVVIGCGVDVLILLLVVPLETAALVVGVLALSSLGIIARSIYNEWDEEHRLLEEVDREL